MQDHTGFAAAQSENTMVDADMLRAAHYAAQIACLKHSRVLLPGLEHHLFGAVHFTTEAAPAACLQLCCEIDVRIAVLRGVKCCRLTHEQDGGLAVGPSQALERLLPPVLVQRALVWLELGAPRGLALQGARAMLGCTETIPSFEYLHLSLPVAGAPACTWVAYACADKPNVPCKLVLQGEICWHHVCRLLQSRFWTSRSCK